MSAEHTLWLSEQDVVRLMHFGEAIDVLEAGLRLEAAGQAKNMAKTHVAWGDGHTLHAIGATFEGAGFVGTKTWAHTAGGATPLLLMWDSETGSLQAIIEAFALGQMRTGSMTGVATRWLAAADADELAQIGAGKQALTQVAAVAAVRPIRRVRLFSPNRDHREAFARRLTEKGFDCEIETAENVRSCVSGAPIVTLVTRAREPFLGADMVARGAHVNAVGAISPEREEFDQNLFSRADVVAVDSVSSVRRLSKEFMTWFGMDEDLWGQVKTIGAILSAGEARPAGADVTIFKAMGMGISDLSLGLEIYRRAQATGSGRLLDHPQRAELRLGAS